MRERSDALPASEGADGGGEALSRERGWHARWRRREDPRTHSVQELGRLLLETLQLFRDGLESLLHVRTHSIQMGASCSACSAPASAALRRRRDSAWPRPPASRSSSAETTAPCDLPETPCTHQEMLHPFGLVAEEVIETSRRRAILTNRRPAEAQRRHRLIIRLLVNEDSWRGSGCSEEPMGRSCLSLCRHER